MKENDLDYAVCKSLLLTGLTCNIRTISYEYEEQTLKFFVTTFSEPLEGDVFAVDVALTEILGQFPEIMWQKLDVVKGDMPWKEAMKYKHSAFLGAECLEDYID